MPFNVLKCYQCNIFQIHPQTKSSKWRCKMCNEKQSFLKVYMTGTAPDCRKTVQQLNMRQGETDHTFSKAILCPQPENLQSAVQQTTCTEQSQGTDSGLECHMFPQPVMTKLQGAGDSFSRICHDSLPQRVSLQHETVRSSQGPTIIQSKWSKYLDPSDFIKSSSEEEDLL